MLTPACRVDRPALAAIIPAAPVAGAQLSGIVQPLMRREAEQPTTAAGEDAALVENVSLLVETGQHGRFDPVLNVQARVAERVRPVVEDRLVQS